MENQMTPTQALNYLESLGVVISNGRPYHNIEAITAVAVLKPLIPMGPKSNGAKPEETEDSKDAATP